MDDSIRDSERDHEISSAGGANEPIPSARGVQPPNRGPHQGNQNAPKAPERNGGNEVEMSKNISERDKMMGGEQQPNQEEQIDLEQRRQEKKKEKKDDDGADGAAVKLPIDVDEMDIQEVVNDLIHRKQTRNEQSIIALEEKVNYVELMAHIQSNHPKIDVPVERNVQGQQPQIPFKSFGLCDELGFLAPCFPCCQKKEPTLMAQKIGLGPTLFLMSTKAFGWFFLAITVINIPVLAFYASGNQASYNSFTDAFSVLSMGNVGQSGFACSSVYMDDFYGRDPKGFGYNPMEQLQQYDRYSNIIINCGIGSKIGSLV